MMRRPWFGHCPYCGGRMTAGLHAASWEIGALVGGIVLVLLSVFR